MYTCTVYITLLFEGQDKLNIDLKTQFVVNGRPQQYALFRDTIRHFNHQKVDQNCFCSIPEISGTCKNQVKHRSQNVMTYAMLINACAI